MTPLLVTRAEADARVLAARIGPHAVVAPCLAYETVATARPLFPHADLLVASPRSAPILASIGLDPTWRVLALAPATAAALEAVHVPVHVAITGGGAALARAARPDAPVIAATSDLGGDEVLRVRPDAVLWVLYRTVCPDALPPEALAAMHGPFDVLFTSPSAVRNFATLAPGALPRTTYTHGGTTADEVRRLGREPTPYTMPT